MLARTVASQNREAAVCAADAAARAAAELRVAANASRAASEAAAALDASQAALQQLTHARQQAADHLESHQSALAAAGTILTTSKRCAVLCCQHFAIAHIAS